VPVTYIEVKIVRYTKQGVITKYLWSSNFINEHLQLTHSHNYRASK